MARSLRLLLVGAVVLGAGLAPAIAARAERLALRHVELDLPGAPSTVLPADLNGDGRNDLVVVVAYTEIDEIGVDRVENMVQISTVIPAVFDRREIRVYLASADGTYAPAAAPLPLPRSVLHLEAGPTGSEVVALTDDGLSRLRFDSAGPEGALRLEPLIEDPPILARTKSFYASLELVHDLDGDGTLDLLLPGRDALAVYLGAPNGLSTAPVHRLDIPGNDGDFYGKSVYRWYPMPLVRDVDGDGIADLVFSSGFAGDSPGRDHVFLGSADGSFRPLRAEALDCHDRLSDLRLAVADPEHYPWPRGLASLRDLDGDGVAEAVLVREKPRGDSFRKSMKDAKRPINRYAFHRLDDELRIVPEPYFETDVIGHTMGDRGAQADDEDFPFHIEQFQDLDGDGREDLVTMTLDFSIFQAVKVLTTKRIGIGIDFHVYAQQDDGRFREVPGLDLSEKLKFDLNNLKLGRFAQFAGDFNGDGRQDFVHLGRGKKVTIHGGQPGCRYPKAPDLSILLDEEPASLDLVRIEDLDGDGLSDLRITRPLPSDDPDTTAPVRLDLYLSGGGA